MHNIVMLGVQGSGKGTQAELLSNRLGIPAISTGRLFRAEIEKKTGLGREIASYIERGDMVPSDIVTQAISERITEEDCEKGFILDGYPRTVEQGDSLAGLLEKHERQLSDVIYIHISDEEAVRRLSGRRVCSNKSCEASYHVEFHPPQKDADKCDRCGNELVQRSDDVPEAIKRRLELYHQDTAPLIEYYRKRGLLREIDGERPIDQVEQVIVDGLGVA